MDFMADPYVVLRVPRGASKDAIRKAYGTMVRQYHPDTGTKPDADMLGIVQSAFHILNDPDLLEAWQTNVLQKVPSKVTLKPWQESSSSTNTTRELALVSLPDRIREVWSDPTRPGGKYRMEPDTAKYLELLLRPIRRNFLYPLFRMGSFIVLPPLALYKKFVRRKAWTINRPRLTAPEIGQLQTQTSYILSQNLPPLEMFTRLKALGYILTEASPRSFRVSYRPVELVIELFPEQIICRFEMKYGNSK